MASKGILEIRESSSVSLTLPSTSYFVKTAMANCGMWGDEELLPFLSKNAITFFSDGHLSEEVVNTFLISKHNR